VSTDPEKPTDYNTQEAVETLYADVIEAIHDHVAAGGDTIYDRNGQAIGRKLNAQVLRLALSVADRAGVNVKIVPGSRAAEMLKATSDELDGLTYTFADDADPVVN